MSWSGGGAAQQQHAKQGAISAAIEITVAARHNLFFHASHVVSAPVVTTCSLIIDIETLNS